MLRGYVDRGFESVADELERQLARSGGGGAYAAYWQGRPVIDVWGGVRDAAGTPWQRDTLCVAFSTTKGVVATALHMLVDRGALDYDDPVAAHWPAFAAAGKQAITVRDVLTHRAGLFNIRDLIDDARRMLDWEHMTDALAAAAPAPVPANATAYQALTQGYIVGELIRRVSGVHVPAFLAREIAEPLGLDGLYVGAPEDALGRAARLLQPGGRAAEPRAATSAPRPTRARRRRRQRAYAALERGLRALGHPVDFQRANAALAPRGISRFDFSADEVLRACIPAANGLFSARSLARLYAALANGGELDGVRLLSEATLARATEQPLSGYDQITLFNMRWRLGYHGISSLVGRPRRAFGHFGWGGSGAWADPTRNLSSAFLVNIGTGTPLGDTRILRLNTALLRSVRKRFRAAGGA